jgi:hypothetical protein
VILNCFNRILPHYSRQETGEVEESRYFIRIQFHELRKKSPLAYLGEVKRQPRAVYDAGLFDTINLYPSTRITLCHI